MTNKEIAERLDAMLNRKVGSFSLGEEIVKLRDELDPPRPVPGTLVWWRWTTPESGNAWALGQVHADNLIYTFGSTAPRPWGRIEWKLAHILGPRQIAVDVPPMNKWPESADRMTWLFAPATSGTFAHKLITYEEAERMEAEDET